jgi:hypothetical protein
MRKTLALTALLLPALTLQASAQDRTIITTGLSNNTYAEGSYSDDVATRKPAGVNMLRGVLDRTDLSDSKVKVAWQVWYSTDEGASFKQWAGASSFGGAIKNGAGEVLTASSFSTAAPPEGSLIINKTTITGGPARTGTVLQMWEVR